MQLLLLWHLRDRKVLVDLRTGFVTVRTREEDGRLHVDGLELHVEALGERECLVWAHPVQRVLDARPEVDLDYLALTGPDLHDPPLVGHARLLVAGRVGSTRLIDNVPVELSLVDPATTPGAP